jgi:hypothetical protein
MPLTSRNATDDTPNPNTARKLSAAKDEGYVQRVQAWFKAACDHDKEAVKQEDEDFRFYSGHQWERDTKDLMTASKRPVLTLNYVLPIVQAVVGEERMNRQQISVMGRDITDDGGAYVMTEVIRWAMDRCNGDYALSKAFRNTAIGGRGWVEVTMNFLDDPQGRPEIKAVKRGEIRLDPLSELEDASDARYLIRERWLSEDEIEAMWPGAMEKLGTYKEVHGSGGPSASSGSVKDNHPGDAYRSKDKVYSAKDGTWQVLEVWHHEVLPGALVVNPETGTLEELTKDELDALLKDEQARLDAHALALAEHEATIGPVVAQSLIMTGNPPDPALLPPAPEAPPRLEYRETPIKRFFQGFVCADFVLERREAPTPRLKRFPYAPCFGMRDEEGECWFGVVRAIKDAQRQHNVEQSAILHWTQTSPKGGWMAPKGAFVDRTRWEQRSSQSGAILEYNPQRGKPEEIRPPALPRHMVELSPARLQAMRDISGVNVDLMGNAIKDTPGVVMEMRRKQGLTVLQTLFDNLRLTRRIVGEILLAYIQEFMADGRMLRIVGPQGQKHIQITQDVTFGQYDVVIEDSTDSPTDKMATMHILQTTLPMLMKAGIPIPPSFVDLLPISPHIRDEWKQLLMGPPPGAQPGLPGQPPAGVPAAGGPMPS